MTRLATLLLLVAAACGTSSEQWYVDPGNKSGCASDDNDGRSSTCDSPGVGPTRSFAGLKRRMGGESPRFTRRTTLYIQSSQASQ